MLKIYADIAIINTTTKPVLTRY